MRVLVADDATLFREGLARVLADAGFTVAGQAADGDELLALARDDPPDVAVLDIRMPPTHTTEGLETARRLRAAHPGVGVLVLSAYVEVHYALQLVTDAPRASGYLLKDRVADLRDLTEAVRRVGEGGLVIDPAIVAQLVGRSRTRSPIDELSEREREVLGLMAEGRSNAAIGERLHLSPKTVEAHVRGIFTRLGLLPAADDNRRVLAVLAHLRM